MSKAPSMPMYWDAYLADTTHLTTEEHGAYLLLLAAMWRRNGCVPDDDKDNARILGLSASKWRKTKSRFQETISGFVVSDGFIYQEKLQKTWEETQNKIEANRRNGAKGGRVKTGKNKDLDKANASVSVKRNSSNPEPEPEPDKKKVTDVTTKGGKPPFANELSEAIAIYNEFAERVGWPQAQKTTSVRRTTIEARLKDCGGIEGWRHAMERAAASDFLCGRNDREWTGFSLDWVRKQSNFTKLMEGNYDNRKASNPPPSGGRETHAERRSRIVAAAARGSTG